jgi:YVTN family beta-propeller protein
LKDTGKTEVFQARPPFSVLATIDTGPITNHVNFVTNAHGKFAYVTVGGLNQVKVFRQSDFQQVAVINVGALPHGTWPSGDGRRVYVGLEAGDAVTAIDTLTNTVLATVPIGQGAQAVVYVPDAVPSGSGTANLEPLGLAGGVTPLTMGPAHGGASPTSVALYDQGIVQVLEAAVTGLEPAMPYVLALSPSADGSGALTLLSAFKTNAAGAAIVNSIGPIRSVVSADAAAQRQYLVILPGTMQTHGAPVQFQQ